MSFGIIIIRKAPKKEVKLAAYTRLESKDVESILALYDIKDVSSVTPLSLGISNSNYRCDRSKGESIILKVSNDKGIAQMKEEQEILNHLKDYPYSLTPIPTSEGESVYTWGELYGAVFPFIEGSKPMGEVSDMRQIGNALGHMHKHSQDHKLESTKTRSHSDVGFDLKGIQTYCEDSVALVDFKDACTGLLTDADIKLWNEASLPGGLIHGDLYIDNMLFKEGKLQTLLDFEQAGLGSFIHDIGITISGCCLDREGVSLDKIHAFIEGYESVRLLENIEKKLLNFSITLGFLDISLWRIKRFYEGDLDPQRKDSYRELLDLAREFVKRPYQM